MPATLTHYDYADAAEAAERGNAWRQAAALWRQAAEASTGSMRAIYLHFASKCDGRT